MCIKLKFLTDKTKLIWVAMKKEGTYFFPKNLKWGLVVTYQLRYHIVHVFAAVVQLTEQIQNIWKAFNKSTTKAIRSGIMRHSFRTEILTYKTGSNWT